MSERSDISDTAKQLVSRRLAWLYSQRGSACFFFLFPAALVRPTIKMFLFAWGPGGVANVHQGGTLRIYSLYVTSSPCHWLWPRSAKFFPQVVLK